MPDPCWPLHARLGAWLLRKRRTSPVWWRRLDRFADWLLGLGKPNDCPGCVAVAKRGIIIGSAQRGPRLTESSRLAVLATIRSARARRKAAE